MMQASMIVSDWQPEIGRSPTPEQLRDIFQKELLDFGPALFSVRQIPSEYIKLILHADNL